MTDNTITIMMRDEIGSFAGDKDRARDLRIKQILPALLENKSVILDFQNVESATQSFIHALISDIIRKRGIEVLDKLLFKNCNEVTRTVIEIVVEYMQRPVKHITDEKQELSKP